MRDLVERLRELPTMTRPHDCNGAGSMPPTPRLDHPCSVCGTAEGRIKNRVAVVPTELLIEVVSELSDARKALAIAAIPLEVLHADNYIGAKWMAPETKQAVAEAVRAIRHALGYGRPIAAHPSGGWSEK